MEKVICQNLAKRRHTLPIPQSIVSALYHRLLIWLCWDINNKTFQKRTIWQGGRNEV
jgi:hypothetical protein